MSVFSEKELEYLRGQRLARLATIGPNGKPHVVPTSFFVKDGDDVIDVGGLQLAETKKWRDVRTNPNVALVIDDVLPPWQPRGIEIRGRAEQMTLDEPPRQRFGREVIRIFPERIVSWGIDDPSPYRPNARSVKR